MSGIKEYVIDLAHNQLFEDKSPEQRDKLLTKLQKVNGDGCRLNLSHNGESVIARAMAPLLDAIRQHRLTTDIVNNHIINHLSPVKNLIRGDVANNLFFSNGAGAAKTTNDDIEMVIETNVESGRVMPDSIAIKRPADSSLEEERPAKIARY